MAGTTAAKTLLVVSPYFPPHLGGVEQYVKHIGRRLQTDHGWRVLVATSSPDGRPGRHVDRATGLVVHELPTALHVSNTPVGFGWYRDLRAIVEREQVDVINAHAPVPYMAEMALWAGGRVPFVLTYHAGAARVRAGVRAAAMRLHQVAVLPPTARRADEIICSSGSVANEFATAFAGRRVTTISPGVDPDRFPFTAVPRTPQVLFVGSLRRATAYKGLAALLDAFARMCPMVPAARLEVVGDGDERAAYERLCQRLGVADRVTFSGHLDGSDLAAAYRRCAVVALPTRYDSFPTVLVEAMASGRPVVSTRVGGIPSLVDDGVTGFLLDPSDLQGLTGRLVELLRDHRRATAMGEAAAATVRTTLTWDSRAALTDQVLSRVLDRRRAAPRTVAVVTPYYAPKVGGVEQYAERVSRAVAAEPGLRTLVVTTGRSRTRQRVEVDGDLTTVHLPVLGRLSNTPVNPLWPIQLRRLFRRHDVDVVTTHAPVPLLADAAVAVAGRRPVIATYHAGSMVKGIPRVDRLLRFYERRVLPRTFDRAATLVAVSPASLAHACEGSVTIPPGVDLGTFVPAHRAHRTGPPCALYVGRMDRSSRWKGVDVLIHAVQRARQQFPTATLRLVGDGDDVDRLRALAAELGLGDAVEFDGVLRGGALVDAYQHASVLVLPSLTESESFGMALVEAMACGTPVIGSRVGGIPFVVTEDHDGLLVEPGDVAQLADALVRVFADPDLAAALGTAGRATAEARFSWEDQLAKHLALIDGALSRCTEVPARRRGPVVVATG